MLVLVIGDLFVPERAIGIPEAFQRLLQPRGKIDSVVCLGETSPETLGFLQSLSGDLHKVVTGQSTVLHLAGSMKVGVTHGEDIVPQNDPLALLAVARMMDVDMLLSGATGVVEVYSLEGKFFVNPGSGCESFVLLDIPQGSTGGTSPCSVYVYSLAGADVKIDKLLL